MKTPNALLILSLAATSPRTSPAGRALSARNGYAVRASLSYGF